MSEAALARKLSRTEAKVAILEQMIEDKTRALFMSNERLASSLDYQRQIYRILPEALLILTLDGAVKEVNASTSTLLGYTREECIGMPVERLWPTGAEVLQSVATGVALSGQEHSWIASNQVGIPVLVSVSALVGRDSRLEFLCLASDLRERKQRETETRHAQKLQSVGQLAAGVAHEINTPMQFIGDNVHFLRESFSGLLEVIGALDEAFDTLPQGAIAESQATRIRDLWEDADVDYVRERGPQAFSRALDGVARVSKIVAAMKSFSHPGGSKAPADLNHAIETTLTVAANEYKYVADVELQLGELPSVLCHCGDINQVLLNLIVNAAHAIDDKPRPDGEKGKITVRSSVEGDVAQIAVSDSGSGIPTDVQPRIFEPFFTTKEVGRGTGQGLALSRSIIADKHGGSLTFETEPERGTTFFIRLPLSPGSDRPRLGAQP